MHPKIVDNSVQIDGVKLFLAAPDDLPTAWVGQQSIEKRLTAALLSLDGKDIPLNPCLIGRPGMGKTTLAFHVGKNRFQQNVFIHQCTQDTRPEDLLVTPVLGPDGQISYKASPVVTAMLTGGFAILDEANRMNEKAWASLASLLDHRRYVHSLLIGAKIKAHPEFRVVATMNEDATTYALPEYIVTRLCPRLAIPFPSEGELKDILLRNFSFCRKEHLDAVVREMLAAHRRESPWSLRDAINLCRYLHRMEVQEIPISIDNAMLDIVTTASEYVIGRD